MATRQQIRAAVAAISRTVAGVQRAVPYRIRVAPEPDDFPLVCVYVEAGEAEAEYSNGYETTAALNVEIWASSTGDIDTTLDVLGSAVAAALEQDDTLSDLVDGLIRTGFSYDYDDSSFAANLLLTYQITYSDED
jgi:hypothetical protein